MRQNKEQDIEDVWLAKDRDRWPGICDCGNEHSSS